MSAGPPLPAQRLESAERRNADANASRALGSLDALRICRAARLAFIKGFLANIGAAGAVCAVSGHSVRVCERHPASAPKLLGQSLYRCLHMAA